MHDNINRTPPSMVPVGIRAYRLLTGLILTLVFLILTAYTARSDASTGDVPEHSGLAITGVSVFDGTGTPLKTVQTVVVRRRIIEAVAQDWTIDITGMQRIDGSGQYLMPGLIDSHTHPFARDDYYRLCLANCVTTILDMATIGSLIEDSHKRRAAFENGGAGPRVFFTGPNIDGTSPWGRPKQPIDMSRIAEVNITADMAESTVAQLKSMGVDYVKVRDWLTLEEYDVVMHAANKAGMAVIGHVAGAVPIIHAVRSDQKSVVHDGGSLGGYLLAVSTREEPLRQEVLKAVEQAIKERDRTPVFGKADSAEYINRLLTSYDEEKAAALTRALVENRTVLVPTLFIMHPALEAADPEFDGRRLLDNPAIRYVPKAILNSWKKREGVTTKGEEDRLAKENRFRRLMELLGRFYRAGGQIHASTDATWLFGTDTTWVIPGFSLHNELMLLTELGMTAAETIAAATSGPARFLGLRDVGTIAAGKAADLVLLTANPLENIRNTRMISAVVSNGQLFDRAALDEMLVKLVQR